MHKVSIMKESGYYPAGAEFDPRAPYNREDPPEMSFDVRCIFTVEKVVPITTDNYFPDCGGCEMEPDASGVDWQEEYDNDKHSIPQLLDKLHEYLKKDMKAFEDEGRTRCYRYRQLKSLADECQGWEVTNAEFEYPSR